MERLQTSIDAIQVQLLELQKDSPTRDEVASLATAIDAAAAALGDDHAQTREDLRRLLASVEEVQAGIEDSEFRLSQLAQQVSDGQRELAAVRDIAERARAVPARPVGPGRSGDRGAASSDDPQMVYDEAYASYLAGNYDLAIVSLLGFLDRFGASPLADNATYWLGESYYRQSRFPEAIEQFERVLSAYRDSDRAASSLLRKSYAYLELGRRSQGITELQKVVCDFGGTDEARLATRRLTELGLDPECDQS